jgi:hypothetical protein
VLFRPKTNAFPGGGDVSRRWIRCGHLEARAEGAFPVTLLLAPFQPLVRKTLAALEEGGDALLRFVEPDGSIWAIIVSRRS